MLSVIHKLKQSVAAIDWPGVTRLLMIQSIIICMLSVAVIRYIDWSSEVARTEFTGSLAQTASIVGKPALCSAN